MKKTERRFVGIPCSIFLIGLLLPAIANSAVMYGVSVGGNRDYPGSDYARFTVFELEKCVKSCADDRRCKAFSYDPRINSCRLKDSVPQPVRARRIKSGRKLVQNGPPAPTLEPEKPEPEVYPPSPPQDQTQIEILYDTYIPGRDYESLTTRNFRRCSKVCKKDDRCKAFSFNERTNRCWLKSHRRGILEKPGTVSGIKHYQP